MPERKLLLTGAILAALACFPCIGGTLGSASVCVIAASDHDLLPGVTVSLVSPDALLQHSGVTHENGCVSFVGLQPGRYEVRARLIGFMPTDNLAYIHADHTDTFTLSLHFGDPGCFPIMRSEPTIDLSSSRSATLFTSLELTLLPNP